MQSFAEKKDIILKYMWQNRDIVIFSFHQPEFPKTYKLER